MPVGVQVRLHLTKEFAKNKFFNSVLNISLDVRSFNDGADSDDERVPGGLNRPEDDWNVRLSESLLLPL